MRCLMALLTGTSQAELAGRNLTGGTWRMSSFERPEVTVRWKQSRSKLKTKLGREDIDDEDGYPLQEEAVATVTDNEIRLADDW